MEVSKMQSLALAALGLRKSTDPTLRSLLRQIIDEAESMEELRGMCASCAADAAQDLLR